MKSMTKQAFLRRLHLLICEGKEKGVDPIDMMAALEVAKLDIHRLTRDEHDRRIALIKDN